MHPRLKYFIALAIIIPVGLLSRQLSFIPLWVGDSLYAVMAYFLVRFVHPHGSIKQATWMSLAFCYLIEISQCWHPAWLVALRDTLLGRLVLGRGFLWSDIVAYTAGVGISYIIDRWLVRKWKINDQ